MSSKKLSPTQREILDRLEAGQRIIRTQSAGGKCSYNAWAGDVRVAGVNGMALASLLSKRFVYGKSTWEGTREYFLGAGEDLIEDMQAEQPTAESPDEDTPVEAVAIDNPTPEDDQPTAEPAPASSDLVTVPVPEGTRLAYAIGKGLPASGRIERDWRRKSVRELREQLASAGVTITTDLHSDVWEARIIAGALPVNIRGCGNMVFITSA